MFGFIRHEESVMRIRNEAQGFASRLHTLF